VRLGEHRVAIGASSDGQVDQELQLVQASNRAWLRERESRDILIRQDGNVRSGLVRLFSEQ
jgi:hypothetical protein